jgi:hypothetical protein
MTWRNIIRSLSRWYWYSFDWFCLYWFWSLCLNGFLYFFYIFSRLWSFSWLRFFWFLGWRFFFLLFRYNWFWFWWAYSWFLGSFLLLCAYRNTFFLFNNRFIDSIINLYLSVIILNFFLIFFYLNRRRLDFSFILIIRCQSNNLFDLLVFRLYFILDFLDEFKFLSSLLVSIVAVIAIIFVMIVIIVISVILISWFVLWGSLLRILSSCW